MIKLPKPQNLNGDELRAELLAKGVDIGNNLDSLLDDGQGFIYVNADNSVKDIVENVVLEHNGNIIPKQPTINDKLGSLGLNLDELKAALGL
jgi:hypothetical protein